MSPGTEVRPTSGLRQMRDPYRETVEFIGTTYTQGDIDPKVSRCHYHTSGCQRSNWERAPRQVPTLHRDPKPIECVPRVEGQSSQSHRDSVEVDESHKEETSRQV